jgi:hypothetical protein
VNSTIDVPSLDDHHAHIRNWILHSTSTGRLLCGIPTDSVLASSSFALVPFQERRKEIFADVSITSECAIPTDPVFASLSFAPVPFQERRREVGADVSINSRFAIPTDPDLAISSMAPEPFLERRSEVVADVSISSEWSIPTDPVFASLSMAPVPFQERRKEVVADVSISSECSNPTDPVFASFSTAPVPFQERRREIAADVSINSKGASPTPLDVMPDLPANAGSGKHVFCQHWLAGRCPFSAEQCVFAHGIQDLDPSVGDVDLEVEAAMPPEVEAALPPEAAKPLRYQMHPELEAAMRNLCSANRECALSRNGELYDYTISDHDQDEFDYFDDSGIDYFNQHFESDHLPFRDAG